MHRPAASVAIGAALCVCGPALAQTGATQSWHEYDFNKLGIAKTFPAKPAMSTAPYGAFKLTKRKPVVAGKATATVYTAKKNNATYRMIVVPLKKGIKKGASIMGECVYMTEDSGEQVLARSIRAASPEGQVYGYRITINLPKNKGRRTASCFYHDGMLYKIEADIAHPKMKPNAKTAMAFTSGLRFLE